MIANRFLNIQEAWKISIKFCFNSKKFGPILQIEENHGSFKVMFVLSWMALVLDDSFDP